MGIEAALMEQIKHELLLYLRKEKTYMNYTSCMQELDLWISQRAN